MTLLQYSYLALFVLVVSEFILIRQAFKHALWTSRLITTASDVELQGLTPGVRIPKFRAPLLDSSDPFTEMDLFGENSALLFVRPASVLDVSKSGFQTLVFHLARRVDGPVYCICSGSLGECRRLHNEYFADCHNEQYVQIVIDSQNELKEAFGIQGPISAVVVEPGGIVSQTGFGLVETDAGNSHELLRDYLQTN